MDKISVHTYSDYYIVCERKSSEDLIRLKTGFNNIEITEYSSNTEHRKYSVFHTLKCKQYQRDSIQDKQHIQDLANLLLQFCRKRMNIGKVSLKRPQPSPLIIPENYA